jgi:hypothetical protein
MGWGINERTSIAGDYDWLYTEECSFADEHSL